MQHARCRPTKRYTIIKMTAQYSYNLHQSTLRFRYTQNKYIQHCTIHNYSQQHNNVYHNYKDILILEMRTRATGLSLDSLWTICVIILDPKRALFYHLRAFVVCIYAHISHPSNQPKGFQATRGYLTGQNLNPREAIFLMDTNRGKCDTAVIQ